MSHDALNREWTDISSEEFREYVYADSGRYRIDKPKTLHVSDSGGHRLLDGAGVSHYVAPKWIAIEWKVDPPFVK